MSAPQVITFDLYNTLIETGHSHNFFKTLYKTAEEGFGMNFSAYRHLILTKPLTELFAQMPAVFEKAYQATKAELSAQLYPVRLYADTIEVLETLQEKYPLYLLSNAASPYKRPFYELGLDLYFKESFFSCDVGLVKPDKAIFKLVEKASGCNREQILMIGDSKKADMEGARRRHWQHLRIERKKSNLSNKEIKNLKKLLDLL